MDSIAKSLKNTLSISLFNRGQAGKIFDSVKKEGAKIVIKNNNPECVLISPEEYINLIEELENARLMQITLEREAKFNGHTTSFEDVLKQEGIDEKIISDFESVEID